MAKATAISRNKRSIKKAIDYHVEWMQRKSEFTFGLAERGFAEYLSEDDFIALKLMPTSLRQFAAVYANRGIVDFCDRGTSGWRDIDRSIAYRNWITRLEGSLMLKRASTLGLDFVLSPTACLLAFSLLHDMQAWEKYFSDVLFAIATTPGLLNFVEWKERFFEPFMLQLRQKLRGEPLLAHADLGPYAAVLAHWEGDRLTAEHLEAVCDYHCKNMIDHGGDWSYEFDEAPFDLYPVEILAIYAVRERLGLPTPAIDHPLLSTPLSSTARRTPVLDDDSTLLQVGEIYQRVFER